ncbi:hydrolase [Purpureocillium lavendulum]|uniref:Hydrolase n=1 Tax=Purpureocillium lavendulum TaxID=1247861 RepID=A0AB34G2X5_9HYPO|nr:hydrolase [Purpureocillium lavendulum]
MARRSPGHARSIPRAAAAALRRALPDGAYDGIRDTATHAPAPAHLRFDDDGDAFRLAAAPSPALDPPSNPAAADDTRDDIPPMDDTASAADAAPPPIPARHHHVAPSTPHNHNHNQHALQQPPPHRSSRRPRSPPAGAARRPGSSAAIPPASPEVISNLITSLSVISQPANTHFESPTAFSLPASPALSSGGSFGVDYGAYNRRAPDDDALHRPVSLDELAASPPVVRTSKPPSGFSPLTAPKSPKSSAHRSSSHESITGGLRSFIRSGSTHTSRPSSPGSLASGNGGDSASIGNLSIERGAALSPDLKPRRSHDSWGKKTNRNSKGLMYMSSKERLRERELEWKRASGSAVATPGANAGMAEQGVASPGGEPNSASATTSRADPFLAGTPIREEPSGDFGTADIEKPLDSPKPIPVRDSSLRHAGSKQQRKRTSARRSRRDSDLPRDDAIIETDEPERSRDAAPKGHGRSESDHGLMSARSFLLDAEETASPTRGAGRRDQGLDQDAAADEDGAPYPAISGGRRRSEQHDERSASRLSGRLSPGPKEALRLTRSSSRLKRHSNGPGPVSPHEPRSGFTSPEPPHTTAPAAYERPDSADSVDDAVESYLCSPRLSQRLRHPQTGRVISFSEVGDPNGSAVFCCVGMGLTRYITAFYDELALTLKLRLITPDRPGVGDSEAYSDGTATPLSWPDDVYAICQALKITKFSILAHSAGAIYALATALRMPQHIRGRIHLLAPWIPPSQMNVFGTSVTSPPTNAIPTSQKILRALPTPFLKAANSSFMTATSSSITSSLPKNARRTRRKTAHGKEAGGTPTRNVTPMMDKENLGFPGQGKDLNGHPEAFNAAENMDRMTVPQSMGGSPSFNVAAPDAAADKERQVTYDTRLTHAIWDLATTGANPAVDLLVCLERRHTIGFRYVDITRPVVIHHGSRDTRVPVDNVKWLGKTMRRCEVRVLEGEGHGLMASATVMGSVLMEMSKEWEDWMRATGADGRKESRTRRGTLGR